MKTHDELEYNKFLALLLTYTAGADNDYCLDEKYLITKKVEFEDLSYAEKFIKENSEKVILEKLEEAYKIYAIDHNRQTKILSDLTELINCDGEVHSNEQEILNRLKFIKHMQN